MNKKENDKLISNLLQDWYQKNKRCLPWRETQEAYSVWISEIILQQTRVNQGYSYFLRFTERFPDIKSLAEAPEDDVLKIWQGLGYYSRARNMHAAAKQIMEKFHGVFPTSHHDILSLKGIGEYTAAAIASIVYNLPHAVVDGNVYRVLSRLFAIEAPIDTASGKKIFAEIAQSVLDEQNPGIHNQALMELGALICTPQQPKCTECPLRDFCLAFEKKTPMAFPVKKRKATQTERFFNYFHIEQHGFTYLSKRNKADIWKNLYEFPLIETNKQCDLLGLQSVDKFSRLFPSSGNFLFTHKLRLKHVLSHRIIHADFYFVELDSKTIFEPQGKYIKIRSQALSDYPVSRLIHKYLETI